MAEKIGVLVIAHGSRSKQWVRLVDDAAKQVKTDHPLTVGFLELVKGRKIQDGIDALEAQGVNRIFAIPLFASSGSKHIEEIRFMLGLTGRASGRVRCRTVERACQSGDESRDGRPSDHCGNVGRKNPSSYPETGGRGGFAGGTRK